MPPSLAQQLEACTEECRDMDAPLGVRLRAMADDVRRLVPGFAEVVDQMVLRLQTAGAGVTAPNVGDVMPTFVLPDENGRLVSLAQLLSKGKLVIAFHRGHWCPYCRISAAALAQIEPEIEKSGGQLVIITPETQKFNRTLKADAKAQSPFLTDLDSGYTLSVDLAIMINDEKRSAMVAAGWDISEFQDNMNWILPIPATFVLNQDGLVLGRFVDPDYRKRMEVEDLLAALDTEIRQTGQD